jgi:general secretion pathway protein G
MRYGKEIGVMNKQGFSLLEVLVAVMIIAIIGSLVGVAVLKEPNRQKVKIAGVQMNTLGMALNHYYLRHGGYPTQEQGLNALVEAPTAEPIPRDFPSEGYLTKKRVPMDPWGKRYVYMVPGRDDSPYEIICYGADGKPGGDAESADISSLDI